MDLSLYFRRIGYSGPTEPTLEVLRAIITAHGQSIPFENLSVLMHQPIRVDAEGVFEKIVKQGRGGYCFETNGLLLFVLEAMGFQVTACSARVRLDRPRSMTPPRTHVFARVEIDGLPWLADVGVGGLSPTAPLRLDTSERQETPHEPRRIVLEEGRWFHQVWLQNQWNDVCEFTGESMPLIDRVVANWYTSSHPESHFRSRLLVARALPEGRRATILNDQFSLREASGHAVKQTLTSHQDLVRTLAEHFNLHVPTNASFECPALPWNTVLREA